MRRGRADYTGTEFMKHCECRLVTVKRKRTPQRYTGPEFKPYVAALGQLALAWNGLQESFAALFWTMSLNGPPKAGDFINDAPLWIWHSIKSDRSQREMLKAAIDHTSVDWQRSKLKDDAIWLINEAMKLEDLRNDALHAPLFNLRQSPNEITLQGR